MLSVVTWKWQPAPGYRSTFGPETVNILARMVRRHYPEPIRFLCVTDNPTGIDSSIEILPDWRDFADVPSPHGGRNPSCYRRLRLFHPDAAQWFGPRFVSLDLDVVITGDLTPLWDVPEDFKICRDTNPQKGSHYNGSMLLLTAGARPQVWTEFNPDRSPRESKAHGSFGSDQGWISYRLGKREAKWTQADGVYSFRNDLTPQGVNHLPSDARVVNMHGVYDPWSRWAQAHCDWIREHYR